MGTHALLVASDQRGKLHRLLKTARAKLNKSEWFVNDKKIQLIPSKKITFLGSEGQNDRLVRPDLANIKLKNARYFIQRPHKLKLKNRQELIGFFNYYATYAGKVSTFSRILLYNAKALSQNKDAIFLYNQTLFKRTLYRIPNDPVQNHIVPDATQTQFRYIINGVSANCPINLAETITEMLTLKHLAQHLKDENHSALIGIDNKRTIVSFKRNRMKYKILNMCENLTLANLLRQIVNKFETRINPLYIDTKENPWNEQD